MWSRRYAGHHTCAPVSPPLVVVLASSRSGCRVNQMYSAATATVAKPIQRSRGDRRTPLACQPRSAHRARSRADLRPVSDETSSGGAGRCQPPIERRLERPAPPITARPPRARNNPPPAAPARPAEPVRGSSAAGAAAAGGGVAVTGRAGLEAVTPRTSVGTSAGGSWTGSAVGAGVSGAGGDVTGGFVAGGVGGRGGPDMK